MTELKIPIKVQCGDLEFDVDPRMEQMSQIFEGMFDEAQRIEGEIVPLKLSSKAFSNVLKFCQLCKFEP